MYLKNEKNKETNANTMVAIIHIFIIKGKTTPNVSAEKIDQAAFTIESNIAWKKDTPKGFCIIFLTYNIKMKEL